MPSRIKTILALCLSIPAATFTGAEDRLQFNRDIRPILSDNCFHCHGQDAAKRAADLRLDTPEGQRTSRAVVPNSPSESLLVERILSTDPDLMMPPADSNKKLTAEQKERLQRWIAEGAVFEKHWSLTPPIRPGPPTISFSPTPRSASPTPSSSSSSPLLGERGSGGEGFSSKILKNTPRIHNPIDNFILAELPKHNLIQSPEADRTTLIRRLSLDLIGLPPTIAEVDNFLADASPEAYEELVDRLLGSKHFGERMALPWLDAARYADTHGYQKDNHRNMWLWRDWVVNAFNANMPFDKFTIEQLAGDLLPHPTESQLIATGFNRNHRINAEAGSIDEEFRSEYVADRVETTATVWLGLTIGCARCHDHKFDPLTQKDYYRFYAFFNSIDEKGVDGVGASPSPEISVPLPELDKKVAEAQKSVVALEDSIHRRLELLSTEKSNWDRLLRSLLADRDSAPVWLVQAPKTIESTGKMQFEYLDDGSILAFGENPLNDVHTLRIPWESGTARAVRIEVLDHPSHTNEKFARSFDGSFVLSGVLLNQANEDGKSRFIEIDRVDATDSKEAWPAEAILDESLDTGWSIEPSNSSNRHAVVFRLKDTIVGEPGGYLTIKLKYESKEEQSIIGRFRVSISANIDIDPIAGESLSESEVEALLTNPSIRTEAQRNEIDQAFLRQSDDSLLSRLKQELASAKSELAKRRSESKATVMVMRELPKPRETFVHLRGAYDRPGEKVEPGVPSCLPDVASLLPEWNPSPPGPLSPKRGEGEEEGVEVGARTDDSLNRLDLARWLVAKENPLTARVAVNRYWQMLFGDGLVRTPEDFGTQGEWPTHPELLDWLATEFVESGWNVKAMMKLIVMSATYRQTSNFNPHSLEVDPDNRWLSRGARFRLPAHLIRDQALAVAGLLVPRIGGPPVKPYQPAGLWEGVAGINSNTTTYRQDAGSDLYRRSLYTYWKRAVPPPSMMIFDAADREVCSVKRRLTNTPLQALTTLNDPTFVEAARKLAESSIGDSSRKTESAGVQTMFRRVLARPASDSELVHLTKAIKAYRQHYEAYPGEAEALLNVGDSKNAFDGDQGQAAAWTTLASLLLNLDESLTKE